MSEYNYKHISVTVYKTGYRVDTRVPIEGTEENDWNQTVEETMVFTDENLMMNVIRDFVKN